MALTRVPVRAVIRGAGLDAETPFVLSFNVNKTRGQSSTFQCSIKMKASDIGNVSTGLNTGEQVSIWAGSPTANKLIFTGVLWQATASPCFDDPTYVIVNASGFDILKMLEGKKFTRRQVKTAAAWCEITGVARRGLRGQGLKYVPAAPSLQITPAEIHDAGLTRSNVEAFAAVAQTVPEGKEATPLALEVSFVEGTE